MGLHDRLLKDFNVLCSSDLDEARAAVAKRYCDHRLDLVAGNTIRVEHNHARGVHVSLNVLSYGADVAINPGELQNFYLLQLPMVGQARVNHRGEEILADVSCGTILNPDRPTQMIWGGDCHKLMVQVDIGFLNRVAQEEIGTSLPGPVRFDPRVPLNSSKGRRILTLSLAAAEAFDGKHVEQQRQDLNLLSLERHLAITLLHEQSSNLSHLLKAALPRCGPTHIRRATEFIQARAHESISLDEIATAAGVHPRTLQTAFCKHVGVAPMHYLRDVRLDRARFHLLRRHNRANVSEIAYDCGYSHLGRFSRDFKARFGHPPSQTH